MATTIYEPKSQGQNGKKQPVRVKKGVNLSYGDTAARLRRMVQDAAHAEDTEAFKHGTEYLEFMIDPDAMQPQRVPDDLSSTSAVFKTRTIFSLPYAGKWDPNNSGTIPLANPAVNGDSTVVCVPGAVNAYFHTNGPDVVTLGNGVVGLGELPPLEPTMVSRSIPTPEPLVHTLSHPLAYGTSLAIIPRRDSAGRFVYELDCQDTQGVPVQFDFRMSIRQVGSDKAYVRPLAYIGYSTQAPGVARVFAETLLPWNGSNEAFDHNIPVPRAYAIYIRLENVDPHSVWAFSLKARNAAGTICTIQSNQDSCQLFKIVTPTDLNTLEKTSQERPLALSVLASYAGSHLANGGLITAARLPMGMTLAEVPDGDYFKFISSLPIYSDDFPLKDGIYAWWCPDSQTEFFYQPYGVSRADELTDTQILVVNMSRDEPEQEVRIAVVAGLEVLSRSNLYAAKVGPTNPLFNKVLEFGKQIPAVAENPTHKQILGRAFQKLRSFVLRPSNWARFAAGLADVFQN